MKEVMERISQINWEEVAEHMHQNGYAVLSGMLSDEQCERLKASYDQKDMYRKTVHMARHRFGEGEYKYFSYPLPDLIQTLRTTIYSHLAPIANAWHRALKIERMYPPEHKAFLQECKEEGQLKATPLILKYGKGGFNTLHQDLYGDIYFPIQLVIMLSDPAKDFNGGEFVLTRQIPRAQSKAIVLNPGKGDMLLFTTQFKPERGSKGYYRVHMKHGVSEVKNGERFTLGIIFHDAVS